MVESRELRVESRRNPQSRRGISLTEVLIAMGIMTVGLLGVASVFPVGGWYMQRAEISDRGSAIAQSVMSDLVARGMLNPSAWFVMVPNASSATTTAPNYFFTGIDGKYANCTYADVWQRLRYHIHATVCRNVVDGSEIERRPRDSYQAIWERLRHRPTFCGGGEQYGAQQ